MPKLVHKEHLHEGSRRASVIAAVRTIGSVDKTADTLEIARSHLWDVLAKNPDFRADVYAAMEDGRAEREQALLAQVDKHLGWKLVNAEGHVLDEDGNVIIDDNFDPIPASALTVDELTKLRRALQPRQTQVNVDARSVINQNGRDGKITIDFGAGNVEADLSTLPKTKNIDGEFERQNVSDSCPVEDDEPETPVPQDESI